MRTIPVRTFSGKPFEFSLPTTSTISDLITLSSPALNIPPDSVRFIYEGRKLDPSMSISDLILPNDSFLICYNQSLISSRPPSSTPLSLSQPRFRKRELDRFGHVIPFNITALVNHITYLQFTRERALSALEFTGYDLNRAISLLVNGKIIGPDGQDHPLTEEGEIGRRRPPRGEFREEPEPQPRMGPRRSEEEQKLNDELKTMSEEQKMAFVRLCTNHIDRNTVLQVFLACDKNEGTAQLCLQSMI
jgi:hypothetical protein